MTHRALKGTDDYIQLAPSPKREAGERPRNHAFDLLCGLCIVRMITLHAICQVQFRQEEWWKQTMAWTFFFMSFFFFKAGYFNKGTKGDSKAYCLDKFRRLMIPYLSWGAISAILVFAFISLWPQALHRTAQAFWHFKWWQAGCTLGNSPLWFLLCFFASYIMVHFIEKVKGAHWLILFFPAISYWLYVQGNPLWYSLNNVFCGAFFFYTGKLWHIALDQMGPRKGLILSLLLTIAFVAANVWLHSEYEMKTNLWTGSFWSVLTNVMLALLGLSGTLLCIHTPRIPILCYIGQHSMVYFVSHYPLVLCYVFIVTILGQSVRHSMGHLGGILLTVFVLCTLLVPIVERTPWLSGRFGNKKEKRESKL